MKKSEKTQTKKKRVQVDSKTWIEVDVNIPDQVAIQRFHDRLEFSRKRKIRGGEDAEKPNPPEIPDTGKE